MTKNNKKSHSLEERYVCPECGTDVPTEQEFCPECGAPMERYADESLDKLKGSEEDEDLDLENLESGIEEDQDPLHESLDELRAKEGEEDDDYDNFIRSNSNE